MPPSDDLRPLLGSINETLAELRTDVQELWGKLDQVVEVLRTGFKDVRDAIHESIEAQAELKLMEHVMEVRAVKPQIEAEQEQIEVEKSELDERLASLQDRYEEKHEELDRKAESRIRELGSHIFEIREDEYEDGVETRFVEQVTAVWNTLKQHNDEVGETRQERVSSVADDTAREVREFIRRQEELIDRIQRHRLDPEYLGSQTEETDLQLPYYVVNYEYNGVSESRLVVPSEIRGSNGDWSTVRLEEYEGMGDLMTNVRGPPDDDLRRESTTASELADTLGAYGQSSLGVSYRDAVASAVPDELPVYVPGGE